MIALRSIAFNILFFSVTAAIAIALLPLLLFPERLVRKVLQRWTGLLVALTKWVAGVDYEVRGLENLPPGPVIVAAKHQSAWETGVLYQLLESPTFVLKRELTAIPFFGWLLKKGGAIDIDRSAGASALKNMVRQTKAITEGGGTVVIFPEGTRRLPDDPPAYHPGVAAIYKATGAPVVPVAVNSGLYWQRRSFFKHPGIITVEFLPVIQPGLGRKAFMAELEERIETACRRINTEARATYPHALPAPLSPPVKTGE